ncbi:hypothetical protein ACS3SW_19580 [Roseobacteraceae bacterium S113]
MRAARLRAALALLSIALFGVLLSLSALYLKPNGMDLFDGRVMGYDLSYAQAYIGGLEADARAFYLGPMRILDTVFPIVFTLFLGAMIMDATQGWSLVSQLLLMLFPGAYLIMDLIENHLVGALLRTPLADLNDAQVALASGYTISKYVALGATVVALILLKLLRRRA